MKLLQFILNDEVRLGVKTDRGVLDVKEASSRLNVAAPTAIQDVILAGDEGTKALGKLIEAAQDLSSLFLQEKELEYQPVVSNPEKIVCVGLNYQSHVEESKMELPSSPVLFSKFNNTLASHNQEISLPNVAEKFDYEAELVIVIGEEAKDVTEEEALSYVFGYSVGNDLSARDLQLKSGQWLIGKTLDHFAPIGPYLVTADEVDPSGLAIECKVNGEKRQSSNTKYMIFNCSSLISYISQYMTLKPGDVIFTGTPEGVILGYSEEEQVWLQSGDEVEVFIENVGTLKNTLI
ncbi:fumarylacetoacetate hydrolase family protein [Aquibacillus sediminis]|uniref:fumarylacetoacetate hydrolase family protein n=1 Tax=Aquibacillus sediminis TaxID=2574734 RepID=UPI001109728C|nr:fumarylacetoacetate hydrolase family protein [Aquibacillus sediminis]